MHWTKTPKLETGETYFVMDKFRFVHTTIFDGKNFYNHVTKEIVKTIIFVFN